MKLSQRGFTLIQTMIAAAILCAVMMAASSFIINQTKANNFIEFQAKKEQLRILLLTQYLNNPKNCKCLFTGAKPFSVKGAQMLLGTEPKAIGRYDFSIFNSCQAPMMDPYVDKEGIDGLISQSIQLTDIENVGGGYQGNLSIELKSVKDVIGSQVLRLRIPVNVYVAPFNNASEVTFDGCGYTTTITGGFSVTKEFTAYAGPGSVGSIMPLQPPQLSYNDVLDEYGQGNTIREFEHPIPGSWVFCTLSGYRIAAAHSSPYEGCFIERTDAGTYKFEVVHDERNGVLCRATCYR